MAAKKKKTVRTKKADVVASSATDRISSKLTAPPYYAPGVTGLKRSWGHIDDEWHPKLRGGRAIKIYREMRDNDPICGSIYYAMDSFMRQAEWTIEPADDSPEAQQVADHVESCFHDMDSTVNEFFSDVNTMIWAGFSLHGTSYKVRRGMDHDLDILRSKHDDGLVGWQDMPIRSQDSIREWRWRKDGKLEGAFQMAPPDFRNVYLDMEDHDMLLFRTLHNKANPEGRSLFRNAYRAWFFLKRIQEIEAIGVEKDLVGMLVLNLPVSFFSDSATPEQEKTIENFRVMGERVRRGEHECMVVPAEEEGGEKTGFGSRLIQGGGRRPIDVNEIVKRWESRVAISVLAEAALLGMQGNVGSWSLASSKTHMFMIALKSLMDAEEDTLNRFAIPRLVRANGWNAELSPAFCFGDIETDDSGELMTSLSSAVTAGLIQAGPEVERYLRIRMGIPEEEKVSFGRMQDAAGAMAESPEMDNEAAAEAALQDTVPIEEEKGSQSEMMELTEAAEYLRVSEARLRNALKNQQLPGGKVGNTWRILRADLDQYMRNQAAAA